MKNRILFVAVLVTAPLAADAQDLNFGALDDSTNVVTVTTGAEYGVIVDAGYARALALADRPIVIGGDLTVAWGDVDVGEFRLRAGALAPIATHGGWKLVGGVAATLLGTTNEIARMLDVGTDVSIAAGRYAHRWFAAGELGFDWAMATHIAPSETYRMSVYADARDGWYGNTGGVLRAGVQAGLSFGRHDVILRAGRMVDVGGDPPMLPFYGTLTLNTRW